MQSNHHWLSTQVALKSQDSNIYLVPLSKTIFAIIQSSLKLNNNQLRIHSTIKTDSLDHIFTFIADIVKPFSHDQNTIIFYNTLNSTLNKINLLNYQITQIQLELRAFKYPYSLDFQRFENGIVVIKENPENDSEQQNFWSLNKELFLIETIQVKSNMLTMKKAFDLETKSLIIMYNQSEIINEKFSLFMWNVNKPTMSSSLINIDRQIQDKLNLLRADSCQIIDFFNKLDNKNIIFLANINQSRLGLIEFKINNEMESIELGRCKVIPFNGLVTKCEKSKKNHVIICKTFGLEELIEEFKLEEDLTLSKPYQLLKTSNGCTITGDNVNNNLMQIVVKQELKDQLNVNYLLNISEKQQLYYYMREKEIENYFGPHVVKQILDISEDYI